MERRRVRRKFVFKQEWYSYCSRHIDYREDCEICQGGTWENVFKLCVGDVWFLMMYMIGIKKRNKE